MQRNVQSFLESSVSLSASNEETLEMAGKSIKQPATKGQKIKEYNNTRMTDFPWHRHEDNADTWNLKVWYLSMTFISVLYHGGDWSGEQKIIFKKRKKRDLY